MRLVSLLLALVAAPALAQSPQLLGLQGRLEDSGGNPVTTPTTLSARLFDHPTTGTLVHVELETVVPDDHGTFVTTLGDGAPLSAASFGKELWAEVETGGTTLSPRLPLRSAPYALKAKDLDPDAPVSMNSQRLTDLADPTEAQDAVTRAYLEDEPFGANLFLARDSAHLVAIFTSLNSSGQKATIYLGAGSYDIGTTPIPDDVSLIGGGTESFGVAITTGSPVKREAGTTSGVTELTATGNITFQGSGRNILRGIAVRDPIVLLDGTDLTLEGCIFQGISGGGSLSEIHLISSSTDSPISVPNISHLVMADSMSGPITVTAGTPEVFLRSSSAYSGTSGSPAIDLSGCSTSTGTFLGLQHSMIDGEVILPSGARHSISFSIFTFISGGEFLAPSPGTLSLCIQSFDAQGNSVCP